MEEIEFRIDNFKSQLKSKYSSFVWYIQYICFFIQTVLSHYTICRYSELLGAQLSCESELTAFERRIESWSVASPAARVTVTTRPRAPATDATLFGYSQQANLLPEVVEFDVCYLRYSTKNDWNPYKLLALIIIN